MAEDTMFSEAVAATHAGEVVRARDLLARLLRADSANPDYWVWMSAVVDSERESVYCLRSVTKMQPNHPLARLGLGVMGQISLGAEREGPIRQHRSAPMPHQSAGRINSMGEWWKVHRNRENAVIAVLGAAAVTVVLAITLLKVNLSALKLPSFGGGQPSTAAVTVTTPGSSEIATYQPVPTLKRTVNPSNLIPFATFIGVELTPTSMYGITPMPITGALDDALEALQAGQYPEALSFLDQVLFVEPRSAQAHYFKGEVYRKQKKWAESLDEYDLATQINANYAMPYFGRAMRSKDINPNNDYDKDLSQAIKLDPDFIDAYIERADVYGRRGEWEKALEDLNRASQVAPENAFVLIRLGRAQIRNGKADLALDNIIRGQISDPTILESYLALGEAYDALNLYSQAITPLVTYTTYAPQGTAEEILNGTADEILGWLRLGEAYTGVAQYAMAVEACSRAVDLNVNSVQARLCRGKVYRLIGEYKKAVGDLEIASNRAPNMYITQFPYGCALLEIGQTGQAIKVLTHAVDLAVTVNEKAESMGWLGLAYEAYSNFDRARKIWEELMAMEGVPEYWKTQAYVHYFGLNTPTAGAETTGTPAESETEPSTPTTTPKP